jgi:nicotinamidase-related amidase
MEWRRAHDITPASATDFNLHLLIIDAQKDFCFPQGTLYVGSRSGTGAIEDNRRLAEFIYRNLGVITHITTTMDTHYAFQIFFAPFWVDQEDTPLSPHTVIAVEEVESGKVRPNPDIAWWLCHGDYSWLSQWVRFYVNELKKGGKYALYLWPPHCLVGSDGHPLVGIIHEARLFHSFVRGVQSWVELKGDNPLTEHYSVLRPEVLVRREGIPSGEENTRFLMTLLKADAVVIAGQADSHCVKNTIDDLLNEVMKQDPALVKKVYIMTDCMSSVVVRNPQGEILVDFTPQAEEAHQRFADAGMHLVQSTEPIASWPDLRLG